MFATSFFFRIPYCTSILCFPVLFFKSYYIFVSVLEQQFMLLFYTFKHGRPTCRLPLSYLYFSLHNCLNVNTAVLCANTSIFASTDFASYFFFFLSFYFCPFLSVPFISILYFLLHLSTQIINYYRFRCIKERYMYWIKKKKYDAFDLQKRLVAIYR